MGLALAAPVAGAMAFPPGVIHTVCDRLAGPALLAICNLTCCGTGGRIVHRLLANDRFHPIERLGLAFVTGWAALGLVWLGLAACGLFLPLVVLGVALPAFAFGGLGLDRRESGWNQLAGVPWRGLARLYLSRPQFGLPAILALGVITNALLWATGPVSDWDSEMYHLPLARFLVDHHGLAPSFDSPLMNVPGAAHLWYAAGLMAERDNFAPLCVWQATLWLSILGGAYAARRVGTHAAFWTPPIFWSAVLVSAVAASACVEPVYGLMLFAAFLLLQPGLSESGQLTTGRVLMAGLCLGTAAGVKYQAMYGWPLAALCIGVATLINPRLRTAKHVAHWLGMFLVAAAVVAPWWIKNARAFDNPVYPALNRGQVDANSLTHANPIGPRQVRHWGSLATDTATQFLSPNHCSGPPNQFPNYLFLLLPLLMIAPRQRAVAMAVGLGLAYHAVAISLTIIHRHSYPAFVLLSIGVAYLLAWGATRRLALVGSTLLSLALIFSLLLPSRVTRFPLLLASLVGVNDGAPLLESVSPGFHAALDWLNKHTEKQDRVLFCWDARQYRLQRPVIIDPGGCTWHTLFANGRSTAPQVAHYLHAQRVNFVLVNYGSLQYGVLKSHTIAAAALDEFKRQRALLLDQVLTPVFQRGPVTVYSVSAAGPKISCQLSENPTTDN